MGWSKPVYKRLDHVFARYAAGDLFRFAVAQGDPVRVSTTRGEIILTANVSDTIRKGVASIPHGHEAAHVNLLTSVEDVDRMTGMVLYTGIPITVAPAHA